MLKNRLYVVETLSRKEKVVAKLIEKMSRAYNMHNVIFGVFVPDPKCSFVSNYVFIDMIATPSACNLICNISGVKRILSSDACPIPVSVTDEKNILEIIKAS